MFYKFYKVFISLDPPIYTQDVLFEHFPYVNFGAHGFCEIFWRLKCSPLPMEKVQKLFIFFSLWASCARISECVSFLWFSFFLDICSHLCCSYFRPCYFQMTNPFLFLSCKFPHAPSPESVLTLHQLELQTPKSKRCLINTRAPFSFVVINVAINRRDSCVTSLKQNIADAYVIWGWMILIFLITWGCIFEQ